jgi:hypothetical protein
MWVERSAPADSALHCADWWHSLVKASFIILPCIVPSWLAVGFMKQNIYLCLGICADFGANKSY